METKDINKQILVLINDINRADRIKMTYKNMICREFDQPNAKIDKIISGENAGEYAFIIKSGPIPIFMKILSGLKCDNVVNISKSGAQYTISFQSGELAVIDTGGKS